MYRDSPYGIEVDEVALDPSDDVSLDQSASSSLSQRDVNEKKRQGHPVIVDYFYHEEIRGTENTGKRNR